MIKVSIAGATGYTAGELIRILVNHPHVELVSLISTTSVGQPVWSAHRDLLGVCDLNFTQTLVESDVLFLCLGHGLSKKFLEENMVSNKTIVIDLGNDFRLESTYNEEDFLYGLPEQREDEISKSRLIANPGCFATSIILGLLPLANSGNLNEDINVTAITGSTGAGKTPGNTTHFSYREGNISIYKLFEHQHLGEIKKSLSYSMPKGVDLPTIDFVPIRGGFTRGIFASIYTKNTKSLSQEEVLKIYKEFYSKAPFVVVTEGEISLKEVVNTNKNILSVQVKDSKIHVTSIIDNLIKGASGQAVQNMNIILGLPQDCGLKLKATAF